MIPFLPWPQFCASSAAVLTVILDRLSKEDEVVFSSFCKFRHGMLGGLMVFVTVQFLPVEKDRRLSGTLSGRRGCNSTLLNRTPTLRPTSPALLLLSHATCCFLQRLISVVVAYLRRGLPLRRKPIVLQPRAGVSAPPSGDNVKSRSQRANLPDAAIRAGARS